MAATERPKTPVAKGGVGAHAEAAPAGKADELSPELKKKIDRKVERAKQKVKGFPREAQAFYARKRVPVGSKAIPTERYAIAREQMKLMRQYSSRQKRFFGPEERTAGSLPAKLFNGQIEAAELAALGTWEPLGPGNIGGRTRALLIHPTSPNIMYAGGVAGGVWKTTDSGASWVPLTDTMSNIAISTMAFDPADPNTIYAGTGEGYFNIDSVRGAGIFKTTDGGSTWSQLASTNNSNFFYVNKVVVRPNGHVYAATQTGVWRSLNAGSNWTQVHTPTAGTFGGCLDLAVRTDQVTDYIFASCHTFSQARIFRNTDAGGAGSWTEVFTQANMGRTSLAIAPSNQNVIYALSAKTGVSCTTVTCAEDGLHAVFRSTNSGDSGSWTARVSNTSTIAATINGVLLTNPLVRLCFSQSISQGWYDNVIAVDPTNPEIVWVGGIDLFRSDDGGANWNQASHWWRDGASNYAHADQHAIVFHPHYNGTSNKTMFVGNDGGVHRTDDALILASGLTQVGEVCSGTGGAVWTDLNNGYGVTQFYHGVPYPDGTRYLGGTQDNGTLRGTDSTGDTWTEILGGDGGYVAIDPSNTQVVYAENTGLSIQKSTNGGTSFVERTAGIAESDASFLFIAPFHMDPGNAQRLWTGGAKIWRTTSAAEGVSAWTQAASVTLSGGAAFSAFAASPVNGNSVLAGTDDGRIFSTTSGLTSTSSTVWPDTTPRAGYVSSLTFAPDSTTVAYATYSTFGGGAHVWKSTNGGATWTAIAGSGLTAIPDIPAHSIVVDPSDTQHLYVGTDLGVFVSLDGGATWAVENTGFANTVTESLSIVQYEGTPHLYAFTHGRGAWRVEIGDDGLNNLPVINNLSPSSKTVNSGAFTLTVNGSGFTNGQSVVRWNGVDRPTTFVSSTQLTAQIAAEDIGSVGSATVTVFTPEPGGGTSNGVTFSITSNPTPAITTLSPSSISVNSSAFTLTVNGSGFIPGSVVRWNGSDRSTAFVSASQLTAQIQASDITSQGSVPVTVFNPAPGGGTSNSVNFTVGPPAGITVTSPNGGEALASGARTISWSYTGDIGSTVKIELLRAGALLSTITSSTSSGSGGTGSFNWTIPTTQAFGVDYRVRITSNSSGALTDTSNADFRITTTGIQVTAPNGGESWQVGTQKQITWAFAGSIGTAVRIELMNGTAVAATLATAAPIGTSGNGSFNWNIPANQALGSNYRIRVTSNSTTLSRNDSSNSPFTLTNNSLTVTSPNGGQSFRPGTTQNITWTSSGSPGANVKIELLQGGNLHSTIAASVPTANGTYSWNIDGGHTQAANFRVRITSLTDAAVTDTSNADFTIDDNYLLTISKNSVSSGQGTITSSPAGINCGATCTGSFDPGTEITLSNSSPAGHTFDGWSGAGCSGTGSCVVTLNADTTVTASYTGPPKSITVTAPNGGESWTSGARTISWSYTGDIGSTVTIELLKNGIVNRTISSTASAGSNGSGSFSWSLPTTQTFGVDYRIRVRSASFTDTHDSSNANFRINTTGIQVTSPNGGEQWQVGTQTQITWSSAGSIGTAVRIELLKGTTVNRTISTAAQIGSGGNGSFNWNIPSTQTLGNDFKIRVTSNSTTTPRNDSSDANFTLTNNSVTVTSPNGGQSFRPGTTQNITWTASGNPGADVKIELLQGGNLHSTIATSVPTANGTYSWNIDGGHTQASNFRVRITSLTDAAVTDTSNADFTIDDNYLLTISKNVVSSGQGTVTSLPVGINCGATCTGSFDPGTEITLSNSSPAGHTFDGWSGAGCSGTGSCVLTLNGDTTVTASYTGPPKSITVTAPNGGENWASGTRVITWSYTGDIGSTVTIELLKNGVVNRTISSSAPAGSNGSGSFNWSVLTTQTFGVDYRVRVRSNSFPDTHDTSNADFRINTAGIQVLAPNGGENWTRGSQQIIRWANAGSIGTTVKIELLKGSTVNRTITSSTSISTGQFTWTIPTTQTVGSDYRIRITSSSTTIPKNDSSNANFTISVP